MAWPQTVSAVFSSKGKTASNFEIDLGTSIQAGAIEFSKAPKESQLRLSGPGKLDISGWPREINVGSGLTLDIATGLSGSNTIYKIGKGALTLSGDNGGFSGDLVAKGGIINLANEAALGTLGNFIVDKKVIIDNTSGGSLEVTTPAQFWNREVVFKGTNDLTFSGREITFKASNHHITVEAGTVTLNTAFKYISSNKVSGIRKHGDGTLVIAPNYAILGGRTVITAGTLQIGNGLDTPLLGAVSNKGTLILAPGVHSPNQWLTGITGRGNVILDGPGSVTFAQGNTFAGGTTVKSGTLYLYTSAPRPLGNGDLALEGGKLTSIYDGVFSLRSDLNWNSMAVIELKLTSNSVSVGKALELSGDGAHTFEFNPGDFVGTETFLVMSVKKGFGDLSAGDFAFTSADESLTGTFRISGKNLYFDATRTPDPNSLQAAAVPEPAAWHLALGGLLGIIVFRRLRMG